MKTAKIAIFSIAAASVMMLGGCSSMNNTGKGAIIGTGGGAALGAGVGALIGGGKGAAIGAAVGGGVGAGTGALIGSRMDKQRAELEKIENAQVEQVKDVNGLKAIKVTFDSGILFATGKSDLSADAQRTLTTFAQSLVSNPGTDITVYGHTDNTGSQTVNQPLSENRAKAVANYLHARGVEMNRVTTYGLADSSPIADNSTVEGRAQNRRVEIFITASEDLIRQIEAQQK